MTAEPTTIDDAFALAGEVPSLKRVTSSDPAWNPWMVTDEDRVNRQAAVDALTKFEHVYHYVNFGNDEMDDYDKADAPRMLLSAEQLDIINKYYEDLRAANEAANGDLAAHVESASRLEREVLEKLGWTQEELRLAERALVAVKRKEVPLNQANCLSSKLAGDNNLHTVAIDIDHPVRSPESSTPGHHHLYIDVQVPWDKYLRLLEAMADCGIVEEGYVNAARRRQATHLRLPWVRK